MSLVSFFCFQKEINVLKDAAGEPTTEAMRVRRTEKNILENEKKCLEKMKNDPPYNKSGTDTVYHYFLILHF